MTSYCFQEKFKICFMARRLSMTWTCLSYTLLPFPIHCCPASSPSWIMTLVKFLSFLIRTSDSIYVKESNIVERWNYIGPWQHEKMPSKWPLCNKNNIWSWKSQVCANKEWVYFKGEICLRWWSEWLLINLNAFSCAVCSYSQGEHFWTPWESWSRLWFPRNSI